MTNVISVEHLSKTYRLGQIGTGSFTHDLNLWWAKMRGKPNPMLRIGEKDHGNRDGKELWALRDVSFTVKQGEVLGIIGRNGAGKSTLLKILSRVTAPTSGRIRVKGRIASLLEVGTGFHPDLTGRENIYLNGAILGMSRKEIDRKFDEIVDFSEVEKFIDTPVKRYSSGMYVRLAFAVAAHLDPEILVVDEVLAVGDIQFQKKCLGKMGQVAQTGRTVLFVSHDLTNILVLCQSVIILLEGEIYGYGPAQEMIQNYMSINSHQASSTKWDLTLAPGNEFVKLSAVTMTRADTAKQTNSYAIEDEILLEIEFFVINPKDKLRLNPVIKVRNSNGAIIFSTSNYANEPWGTHKYSSGIYKAICKIPAHTLNNGVYLVDILIVHESRAVWAEATAAIKFSVYDSGFGRGDYVGEWVGLVRPRCMWDGITIQDNY